MKNKMVNKFMKIGYAIVVLEATLKDLKRQRDVAIFQSSYAMRFDGSEIEELENALKILRSI